MAAGGGMISRNSALNNAQSIANARNGALANTITGLDSIYNKTNAPAFNSAVGAVDINKLGPSQDARVANNVGAITKPDINAPASGDAPPSLTEVLWDTLQIQETDLGQDYGKLELRLRGAAPFYFDRRTALESPLPPRGEATG
jgi:hypothetical protein